MRSEECGWEVGRSVEMLFIFCPMLWGTRCEWQVSEGPLDSLPLDSEQTTISRPPPHHPLPPAVIERLRALAKKPRPLLRPSARYSRTALYV